MGSPASRQVTARAYGRADLARIAAEVGVSIASVSRVLNGRSGVAPETRERIEAAIAELDYVRRVRAPHSAPLLELVLPYLQNDWAVELVRGVQRVARDHRMSVVVTRTGDRHGPGDAWLDEVFQREVGAIVLMFAEPTAAQKARLRARNVPFATVAPGAPPSGDVPTVSSLARAGAREAVQHLIGLGHERIALISGPPDLVTSREREAGFREALRDAGIPVDEELVKAGRFLREDGEALGRELLTAHRPPSAIFAGSDNHALGVYRAARSLGVGIPDRLSVVGFDDLEIGRLIGPPLTTVRQPLADMAEQAARMALSASIDTPRQLELPTRLVVRGSTAAPPPRASDHGGQP